MNRKELLRLLLTQAKTNGFDLHHWFVDHVKPTWPGDDAATNLLAEEGRYYTLIFSHEFASKFWRSGGHMSFKVPQTTYHRVNSRGAVVEVTRKGFTRRTIKPDVWRYHIRQMALDTDPIQYLCRFLPAPEQIMMQEPQIPAVMIRQAQAFRQSRVG